MGWLLNYRMCFDPAMFIKHGEPKVKLFSNSDNLNLIRALQEPNLNNPGVNPKPLLAGLGSLLRSDND
jgi:hypothetical protein